MYSDKENINILTALLVQHGVKHVVVCPGSRNSALTHNFNEHPALICHPVTDERSAGFLALGIALQNKDELVAVCVTSGSALLNVLPAVAEASYQHCRMIVISADRPAQWVDQLDGQTIPQVGGLGNFVTKTVNLPEPKNEEERWYCNRLVNEAVIATLRTNRPVHINVPITEPFFSFTTPCLEEQRKVSYIDWGKDSSKEVILEIVKNAKRPMVVFGQIEKNQIPQIVSEIDSEICILHEPLSVSGLENCLTDQMLSVIEDKKLFEPDVLFYFGGHTVSKRLRHFMRQFSDKCNVVMVDEDGELRDISMHAKTLIHGETADVANEVFDYIKQNVNAFDSSYSALWRDLRKKVRIQHDSFNPDYSSMKAVKLFEERYGDEIVHYANSMSVRLGAVYCEGKYRYCNRGINGIEGSLSTAAGASLALQQDSSAQVKAQKVFCVIGDLSFFYDENALWQQQLSGNFRILLLNNNEGTIFRNLKGLEASPVRDTMIAASHNLSAEGICMQFSLTYKKVTSDAELQNAIDWLGSVESNRPVVLEVITKAEEDERVYKEYYKELKD